MLYIFHILSMNAWDILFWTAAALVVARLVAERREKLWLVAGILVGLGLETKTSMAFLVAGLGVGVLLTPEREWLRNRYFWIGAAIAAAIAAPHLAWQIANEWPTLEFIRNANEFKNARLTPPQFAGSQLLELHPVNAIVLLAALWFFFTAENGRFRLFAWAYVTIFLIVFLQNGKTYYLSPSYPFMLAGGSVAVMRWLTRVPTLRPVCLGLVVIAGAITAPAAFPVLSIERYMSYSKALGLRPPDAERNATAELPQHFADMFGWNEMVATVAAVHRSLPPHEQRTAGIFALNYGEAGAVDFLGPRHGLPVKAISPHNSYYLWGPRDVSGDVLIVIGGEREDHLESYESLEHAATIQCGLCMPYESDLPVYVLRKPRRSMAEIWRTSKKFI
jgi:hypothetical protein